MPKFSESSLKSKPWLWKYDSRRLRGCKFSGHRIRWYRHQQNGVQVYHGFCRYCEYLTVFNVVISDHSLKFVKKFYKVNVVEITPEQSAELLAKYQVKRGRPRKLGTGLDLRKARVDRSTTSQINSESVKSHEELESDK